MGSSSWGGVKKIEEGRIHRVLEELTSEDCLAIRSDRHA
jgi:hypothetical protein